MKHRGILLAFILLTSCPVFAAGVNVEFTAGVGTTNNLISDSSNIYDAYSSASVNLKAYPLSGLEIGVRGDNTYYRETIGLSSLLGGLKLTYIPIRAKSPLSIFLSGDVSGRLYHDEFSGFDNNIGEVIGSLGYKLTPHLSARGGVSFKSTVYVNSAVEYKRDLDFFLGANTTILGVNSFDLEAGFARTNFTHKDNIYFTDSIPPGWDSPWSYRDWFLEFVGESESNLWVFYCSPRYSRSLGYKTGINLTYTVQNFQNYHDEIVYGFSTQFLSPWASVWEGQDVTVNLKSYLLPRCILSAGAGYWDKTYLKTIESRDNFYFQVKERIARQDWQTRIYLGIQWPLALHSGLLLEPNATIDYMKNVSNKPLYNFSSFAVSAGIRFRL